MLCIVNSGVPSLVVCGLLLSMLKPNDSIYSIQSVYRMYTERMCTGTDAGSPPQALKTSSGAFRSYKNVVGSCVIDTDMRRLTTGIRSEKCVVRRFRRCANVYFHKPR